jgi:hypothetical protein
MQAVVLREFGGLDVLRYEQVPEPLSDTSVDQTF